MAAVKPPGETPKAGGPGGEKDPYDLNGDGIISQEEYDKIPAAEQDQYEKSGDGYKKKAAHH
jgi:hypothetical protein